MEARRLLAEAGLDFPRSLQAVDRRGRALAAASEVGYPVVLKALGVLHKSDAGGVALGLEDPEAVASAAAAMEAPTGYSVEQMVAAPGSVELIAGCRWDPRLGPVLLLGLGGIFAEVLRDVAVALAPADAGDRRAPASRPARQPTADRRPRPARRSPSAPRPRRPLLYPSSPRATPSWPRSRSTRCW